MGTSFFPLIGARAVEKWGDGAKWKNYATVRSDLSWFGALPTRSHVDLAKDLRERDPAVTPRIVVLGGQVLGGDWLNLLRFVSPVAHRLYWNRYSRNVIRRGKILEAVGKLLAGTPRPFLYEGDRFKDVEVAYSAVGALGSAKLLRANRNAVDALKRSSWVSVRDDGSVKTLAEHGISAQLAPDSALLMDELFVTELQTFEETSQMERKPYVFAQFGGLLVPDDMRPLAKALNAAAVRHGLKILLCPIGLAPDHNDNDALVRLHEMLPDSELVMPSSVWETMSLIKNASLFVGTSQHGVISAQSFNVPFVSVGDKGKVIAYVNSWHPEPASVLCGYDYDGLTCAVDSALREEREMMGELYASHKDIARLSLRMALGVV